MFKLFVFRSTHEAVVKHLQDRIETIVALGRGREGNIRRLVTERTTLLDAIHAAEQAHNRASAELSALKATREKQAQGAAKGRETMAMRRAMKGEG